MHIGVIDAVKEAACVGQSLALVFSSDCKAVTVAVLQMTDDRTDEGFPHSDHTGTASNTTAMH